MRFGLLIVKDWLMESGEEVTWGESWRKGQSPYPGKGMVAENKGDGHAEEQWPHAHTELGFCFSE